MPLRPDIARYTDEDLTCLSDSVYSRVAKRDQSQRYYQQQLEAVIRSTWDEQWTMTQ